MFHGKKRTFRQSAVTAGALWAKQTYIIVAVQNAAPMASCTNGLYRAASAQLVAMYVDFR
jgi:hypothetical protein